jgi:hypothetical protein
VFGYKARRRKGSLDLLYTFFNLIKLYVFNLGYRYKSQGHGNPVHKQTI